MTRAPMFATVHLSIDRLVVEGFSRLDAMRLQDGFSERLHQLATEGPAALDGLARDDRPRNLPPLAVDGDRSPRAVGQSAAEALWDELTR